uniref:Putative secreted protein n=1 Tax=Ixodes ricinus TaxID=34613 RepID=A0A6B0UX03_IXORI
MYTWRVVQLGWCLGCHASRGLGGCLGGFPGRQLAFTLPLGTPLLVGGCEVPPPDAAAASFAVDAGALHGVAPTLRAVQRDVVFVPAHSARGAGVVLALEALNGEEAGVGRLLRQVFDAVPGVGATKQGTLGQREQHRVRLGLPDAQLFAILEDDRA